MKQLLKKLSSRKLWTAIVGVVTGLGIVFGVDAGAVSTISGALVSVMSVISYIVTEGKIDAVSVADAIDKAQQAQNALSDK